MNGLDYIDSTPQHPCKICGRDKHCGEDEKAGVILCMWALTNKARGVPRPCPPGWHWAKKKLSSNGGFVYVRDGSGQPTELTQEQLEEKARVRAQRKKEQQEKSSKIWDGGLDNHPRVAAYLKARGIDVAKLPGGRVPKALRFVPRCFDEPHKGPDGQKVFPVGPAMVASVVDEHRALTGIHRTFLHPTEPRKRDAGTHGAAKKMKGACDKRSIRLAREIVGGVLIVGEGIETTASCMVATGLTGWALMDEGKLQSVVWPPGLLGHQVHTLIIAEDLDASRVGQNAGAVLANRTRAECPGVTVVRRAPSAACSPGLVEVKAGEDCPAGDSHGVDWNDVLMHDGEEAVRKGLLDGIDLEANAARAKAWASSPASSTPSPSNTSSSTPSPSAEMTGTRSGAANVGERGPTANGEDGSWSDGGDNGGAPWRIGMRLEERPIIDGSNMERARSWLWQESRVPGQRRFGVCYWAGAWWRYTGTHYAKVDEHVFLAQVWDWADKHSYWKAGKKGPELKPLNPSSRQVKEILFAMVRDAAVSVTEMPSRLPQTIDDAGRPMWGAATSMEALTRSDDAGNAAEHASLRGCIVFPNGVADISEIARTKRVVLRPHSAEIFTATCMPFQLPVEDLQFLLDDGEPDVIFKRLCPKWWAWVDDAGGGDPAWQAQLQEMMGDTISGDRSIEKIFAAIGVGRSGKGLIADAIRVACGWRNVESIFLDSLANDKHALAPLVGKTAIIAEDAHVSGMSNNAPLVEKLKVISGQGWVSVRDMYTLPMTVKLPGRIWLFANNDPELRDDSSALANRFIFLPMNQGRLGREDETIKQSIPQEAAGIMLWAMLGAIRLASRKRRAIELCEEAALMGHEYERFTAPLRAFIEDCLVVAKGVAGSEEGPLAGLGNGSTLTAGELYTAYAWWCENRRDCEPLGKPNFYSRIKNQLKAVGVLSSRPRADEGQRPVIYRGVSVRSDVQADIRRWRPGSLGTVPPPADGPDDDIGIFP